MSDERRGGMDKPLTPTPKSYYLMAVGLLAVLAVGHVGVLTGQRKADQLLAAVHVSGRQRMLVQRTALLAQRLVSTNEQSERADVRKALLDTMSFMEQSHAALVHGDKGMNLPSRLPFTVRALFFDTPTLLDTQLRNYAAEVNELARAADTEFTSENPRLAAMLIAASRGQLPEALDAVTRQYQMEHATAMARLKQLEGWLFGLIACLLLLMVGMRLRPFVRRILQRETATLKSLNEILVQRAQELARSNTDLEQFAYVASHDLQEPLRMVASYTQLLAKRYKGKLDADADEFIQYAVDGVTRMQTLINDLLTYSRVGTRGKDFAPTNCEAVVDRALANLKATTEERGVVVTCDPLPSVMADELQLAQVFQNLIGNAIKFNNGRPPRIHISAERNQHEWVFSVSDNGIGIAPEHTERIFGIFQRLHTGNEYPGTGIGLAICKKIVERHGGRIWVRSAPGKGSTFYLTIPVREQA